MDKMSVITKMLLEDDKFTWRTEEKVIEFFKEIETICKKYNLSISHEDEHGAFKIEEYNEKNIEWLCKALDMR